MIFTVKFELSSVVILTLNVIDLELRVVFSVPLNIPVSAPDSFRTTKYSTPLSNPRLYKVTLAVSYSAGS